MDKQLLEQTLAFIEKTSAYLPTSFDKEGLSIHAALKARLEQPEQEPKCNPHPKAPHGFSRNASHSADRYVCECEGWDAYDAGYQAGIEDTYKRQNALDKMAENEREMGIQMQPEQEPVAWMFQHEETGRTMCVDAQQIEWGFEKGNPRLKKIAPLYTTPPAAPMQELQRYSPDGEGSMELDSLGAYIKHQDVATPPGGRQSEDCLSNVATPLAAQEEIQRLRALVRAQQITIDKLEAQRQWVGLTPEEVDELDCVKVMWQDYDQVEIHGIKEFYRAIEFKLKEKNNG